MGRVPVARGASYRYPPPFAVGFAKFALDKTAFGRETAVMRHKKGTHFEGLDFGPGCKIFDNFCRF